MVSATQISRRTLLVAEPWPPDDTEESVVGTDFHQMTITNLRLGINEVARTLTAPGGPVPWQALGQIMVSGFSRPDGSRYTTFPDVFVYRHPIDQQRGSLALALDGPPALIVEVLSDATYDSDLDLEQGKGYSYAQAGVREYLTIDPTGHYLPDGVRAWRLADGGYLPWQADEQGRWQSRELELAIALEGTLAAVYTRGGRRMLREGEIEAERARMREELERLRRLLDERGGQA